MIIEDLEFQSSGACFSKLSPGNLMSPKSYFEIKVLRKVGCVLTSTENHFVSKADNFTASFSKLLKLPSFSLMKNKKA